MATKTGELREMLVDAIEAVRRRQLSPEDAKAIATLAQQINLSLQIEVNARAGDKYFTQNHFGSLAIGDERPVVINEGES